MENIYSKPLRVYIILFALAVWGIVSGFSLPISLFPNSSQITVNVNVPTGALSSNQFYEVYGKNLEANLQGMKIGYVPVKLLTASYSNQNASYTVIFQWGAEPEKAISDIKNLTNSILASADEEIRPIIGNVNEYR